MKKIFLLSVLILFSIDMACWAEIKTSFIKEERASTEKPSGLVVPQTENFRNAKDVNVPKRTRGIERYQKTNVFGENIPDSFLFYRALLNERQQIVYDQVYKALMNYETQIVMATTTSAEEMQEALYAVRLDNPEAFWWSGEFCWWSNSDGTVSKIEVEYWPKTQNLDIDALYDNFWDYTIPVIFYASKLDDDMSKIKYVHDYICLSTDYAYDVVENGQNGGKYQTPYSCVVEYHTVCAGYASAFTYYMQQLGIPCVSVWSNGHEWNLIKINNQFYQIDVTWDDTELIPSYFNLTGEEMQSIDSHTPISPSQELIENSPSTSTDMTYINYFGPLLQGSPYTYEELGNFKTDVDNPDNAKIYVQDPVKLSIIKSGSEFVNLVADTAKHTDGNLLKIDCVAASESIKDRIMYELKEGDDVFDRIDAIESINSYSFSYLWKQNCGYDILSLEITLK